MTIKPRSNRSQAMKRPAENTHADPKELMRQTHLKQMETDPSVQPMSNAHYAAQMANIRDRNSNNQSFRANYGERNKRDPQVGNNQTYSGHVTLSHSHGPTGNPGRRSNGTEYATVMLGDHPTNVNNAPTGEAFKDGRYRNLGVKYKSNQKPVGGARKKTRKHKKESRESKKLRKSRKSRK